MYLECDFNGMIAPEMLKRRPVIVISSPELHGDGNRLSTIVPLSTTTPDPVKPYHVLIDDMPVLPYFDNSKTAWVKFRIRSIRPSNPDLTYFIRKTLIAWLLKDPRLPSVSDQLSGTYIPLALL